jgi:hypothetical protein
MTSQIDALLRGPIMGRVPGEHSAGFVALVGCTTGCGFLYGVVMGTFGGIASDRIAQVLISGIKVPLLLLATFTISVPSFFVLNTLLGVRSDFRAALRILVGGQAGLTVVLAALAPYTMLWYASSAAYNQAVLFNGFMFAAATFTSQWMLRRWYRPLVARNPRQRWLLPIWLILYSFVGIQMAWVLRPFVGDPEQPVQFLRPESWDNAYVIVARMVWETLMR